ncbi:gametocyte-specific factor 1-like [Mytilus edulis]|uniref:gametocyte-specific factor 1-like n=1 Tax=Mytilus edulis TaxID=6550 RepID=UPI0039F06AEE
MAGKTIKQAARAQIMTSITNYKFMMAFRRTSDPDEIVVCPFDKSHIMKARSFQTHLIKCRRIQKYPEAEFETCQFNATHVMRQSDIEDHMAICHDKPYEPIFSYG